MSDSGEFIEINLATGLDIYESSRKHDVPRNAIKTGLSPCGRVYVGIADHDGEVMPAKIIPAYNICYYSYDGKELNTKVKRYLVLQDNYTSEWLKCNDSMDIPRGAAYLQLTNSERIYIGRVEMDAEKCVGKIPESRKLCYVPKCGKEFAYKEYDILVIKRKPPVNFMWES